MDLLTLSHVSYAAAQKKIFDDLSFSIEDGEMHALIGTNGTGKSALARLVIGIEDYRPDSGQILFAGQDISRWTLLRRTQAGISMV